MLIFEINVIKMEEKTENEMSEELLEKLSNKYGEERIEKQPYIEMREGMRIPDFIVYKDSDKTEPLIVIELKGKVGKKLHTATKQLREFLKNVNSKYGALFTPEFKYVFYLDKMDNTEYEVSIPDLPNLDGSYSSDKSPFESKNHILFCLEKIIHSSYDNIQRNEDIIGMIIKNLLRKLYAEKENIEVDWNSDIYNQLMNIDDKLMEKKDNYSPDIPLHSKSFSKTIWGVFNGYSLVDTDFEVKEKFIEKIYSKERKIEEHLTKTSIARSMVKLSNIQDGDSVLDPAVGIGNILRIASKSGGDCYGIEISKDILLYSTFVNEMLNLDMKLYHYDSLKNQSKTSIPKKFDHIFIDPPLGLRITDEERLKPINLDKGINIESAFLKKALKSLREGGELITLLPKSVLFREKDSIIRDYIKNNYKIDVIIETERGGLFSSTTIPGVIMRIINEETTEDYEVKFAELKSEKNIEEELNEAIEKIQGGESETINFYDMKDELLPSKIITSRDVKNELNERFDNLTYLSDVCKIKRGERVEKSERVNKKQGDFPFLRIGDTDKKLEQLSYVKKEETNVITKETDILLSIKGTIGEVYIPEDEVVPAQSWMLLRFDSKDKALVYATFLETNLAKKQLKAVKKGSVIPYVSIRDLSELYVPDLKESEISQKADEIMEIKKELKKYEHKTNEVEKKLSEIF